MNRVGSNVREALERIAIAARGRQVKLVAVTKTVAPDRIREAIAAGLRLAGENRIQEALPKIQALSDLQVEWHFLGHLQTNKVRDAVKHFACIQSVDSLRVLLEIEKEASRQQKKPELLLELNLGGEESKYGLTREQLPEALEAGEKLQWCRVAGLMLIPPFLEDQEMVRPYFRELREIREKYSGRFSALRELSMGMSHDYVTAVEEGATMVRIGTAIFGAR